MLNLTDAADGAPSAPPATEPPAAPAGEQPAGQTAPAETAPATPTSWVDVLPEAYRKDPNIVKYKSMEEFAKGHTNLVKKLGERPPSAPDSADKYTWEPDKEWGLTPEQIAEGKTIAHSLGLDDVRAKTMLDHHFRSLAQVRQQEQAATMDEAQALHTQLITDLRNEWGPKFAENAARAENVLALRPDLAELCAAEGLSVSKSFVKFLLAEADRMAKPGGAPPANSQGTNAGSIDTQIKELMNSREFQNIGHPDHQKAKARMIELYKLKHPTTE